MKRFIAPFFVLLLALGFFLTWKKTQRLQFREPTDARLQQVLPGKMRTALEKSDQLYLYSLDPSWESHASNKFHSWGINGRTLVKDKTIKRHIIDIYYDGIADTNFSAACFSPRHGIRAAQGRSTLDIVICFACGQAKTYFNGKEGWHHFGSKFQGNLDSILMRNKVPLQPRE